MATSLPIWAYACIASLAWVFASVATLAEFWARSPCGRGLLSARVASPRSPLHALRSAAASCVRRGSVVARMRRLRALTCGVPEGFGEDILNRHMPMCARFGAGGVRPMEWLESVVEGGRELHPKTRRPRRRPVGQAAASVEGGVDADMRHGEAVCLGSASVSRRNRPRWCRSIAFCSSLCFALRSPRHVSVFAWIG